MTALSYAVQEAGKDIVAPFLGQIEHPSWKTMPGKTQPGHSGVYQWATWWEGFKDQQTAREEQTFVAEGLWAIHAHAHVLFTLWGSLSVFLHSWDNGKVLMYRTWHCFVSLGTTRQILWRIQRHVSLDTFLTLPYWPPSRNEKYECPFFFLIPWLEKRNNTNVKSKNEWIWLSLSRSWM